ncbi:MAG: hypothetical protein INF52_17305 [Rhodobacter sp.]|nr:hypothetical protein [Rhodobacter sp.]
MSALAWIDFDQTDRDRARRIMDLFGVEDSRDELGLGSIRDALSDLMFPGTSTIQTRLRYMFFVPWLYRMAARSGGRADQARRREIQLITALLRGGETENVIGSEARDSLKRLPSDVYWAGLLALGIRTGPGSRAEMLAAGDGLGLWSPGLPGPPDDLLDKSTFRLTPEEGSFLRDRLAISARDSLFNELAQAGDRAGADAVWLHPMRATWSARNLSIVDQAERFARMMNGASLLYNLMLAERAAAMQGADGGRWHDLAADYRTRLSDWQADTPASLAEGWSLAGLWSLTSETIHRAAPQTMAFVTDWVVLVQRGQPVADDPDARTLILRRESRLKGPKARLTNDAALARLGGASGAAVLAYRWPVVQRHLRDLADAV